MNLSILIFMSLSMLLMFMFFMTSKMEKVDKESMTSFECGFNSYYFSRFSFSIHYVMVGLTFLFLDLELCIIMPFFNETLNNVKITEFLFMFTLILLTSIMYEWLKGSLNWKF